MSQFRDVIARMAVDAEFARYARSHPDEVAAQFGLTPDETDKLRGLADATAAGGPQALGARLSKSGITPGLSGLLVQPDALGGPDTSPDVHPDPPRIDVPAVQHVQLHAVVAPIDSPLPDTDPGAPTGDSTPGGGGPTPIPPSGDGDGGLHVQKLIIELPDSDPSSPPPPPPVFEIDPSVLAGGPLIIPGMPGGDGGGDAPPPGGGGLPGFPSFSDPLGDYDGDGTPNFADPTPAGGDPTPPPADGGLPSFPVIPDPLGDYDGDGLPNFADPTPDGDPTPPPGGLPDFPGGLPGFPGGLPGGGLPDFSDLFGPDGPLGDRDGDGTPNYADPTPDGPVLPPGVIVDPVFPIDPGIFEPPGGGVIGDPPLPGDDTPPLPGGDTPPPVVDPTPTPPSGGDPTPPSSGDGGTAGGGGTGGGTAGGGGTGGGSSASDAPTPIDTLPPVADLTGPVTPPAPAPAEAEDGIGGQEIIIGAAGLAAGVVAGGIAGGVAGAVLSNKDKDKKEEGEL